MGKKDTTINLNDINLLKEHFGVSTKLKNGGNKKPITAEELVDSIISTSKKKSEGIKPLQPLMTLQSSGGAIPIGIGSKFWKNNKEYEIVDNYEDKNKKLLIEVQSVLGKDEEPLMVELEKFKQDFVNDLILISKSKKEQDNLYKKEETKKIPKPIIKEFGEITTPDGKVVLIESGTKFFIENGKGRGEYEVIKQFKGRGSEIYWDIKNIANPKIGPTEISPKIFQEKINNKDIVFERVAPVKVAEPVKPEIKKGPMTWVEQQIEKVVKGERLYYGEKTGKGIYNVVDVPNKKNGEKYVLTHESGKPTWKVTKEKLMEMFEGAYPVAQIINKEPLKKDPAPAQTLEQKTEDSLKRRKEELEKAIRTKIERIEELKKIIGVSK